MKETIYDYEVENAKGEKVSLSDYKNQVLLIVNTASKCGFTPQYDGLEALHKKFEKDGLKVMAFPCNQFGSQEPGSQEQIQEFCSLNFSTTFPIFKKIDVNGDQASPLFDFLKKKAPGLLGSKAIKWNFTKFLVSKDGSQIVRFAPNTKPEDIEKDIQDFLK